METIFTILITTLYYVVGYVLSTIITVNKDRYNPVVICLWPLVLVAIGFLIVKHTITNKNEKENSNND